MEKAPDTPVIKKKKELLNYVGISRVPLEIIKDVVNLRVIIL
jgi:hypothetical protein